MPLRPAQVLQAVAFFGTRRVPLGVTLLPMSCAIRDQDADFHRFEEQLVNCGVLSQARVGTPTQAAEVVPGWGVEVIGRDWDDGFPRAWDWTVL